MTRASSALATEYPRIDLLGVKISAINMDMAVSAIDDWAAHRKSNYICVTPAHSVMECYDHSFLAAIFNASGMTTPDGMAVVWWLRWHGQRQVERVYGPDLMLAVCQHSIDKGYRHFFYGGAEGVAQELARKLQSRFQGLSVAGCYSPPFRVLTPAEDDAICQQIHASEADIVWVGLGAPRQELWMSDHKDKLGASVLIGVGAAFDFLSGRKTQAPHWVQQAGLEWLFRLIHEPRRLWRRYIPGYPRFVVLALRQLCSEKLRKSDFSVSKNK